MNPFTANGQARSPDIAMVTGVFAPCAPLCGKPRKRERPPGTAIGASTNGFGCRPGTGGNWPRTRRRGFLRPEPISGVTVQWRGKASLLLWQINPRSIRQALVLPQPGFGSPGHDAGNFQVSLGFGNAWIKYLFKIPLNCFFGGSKSACLLMRVGRCGMFRIGWHANSGH